MILSMTGYGKSEKQNKNYLVNIEIKSINNRFFDPILKIHPNCYQNIRRTSTCRVD